MGGWGGGLGGVSNVGVSSAACLERPFSVHVLVWVPDVPVVLFTAAQSMRQGS